jgi:hypothetical protein
VLALRGRRHPLPEGTGDPRTLARHRRRPDRPPPDLRRLGHVRLHERPNKPWGDVLCEIDVGIWEEHLDEETWGAWVDAKREIARASLEVGGTISAAHGSARAGEVDLVPLELGGAYDVMRTIKRALDPNNVMNPGKYGLDSAYEER